MWFRPLSRRLDTAQGWLLLGLALLACEPQMLLGEVVGSAGAAARGGDSGSGATAGDTASGAGGEGGEVGAVGEAGAGSECTDPEGGGPLLMEDGVYNAGPLPAPWDTSFEDGFCGYRFEAGFCYTREVASHRIVTAPVRTGSFAAAFDIGLDSATSMQPQARCVREGQLPDEAYYGAWYFLPEPASQPDNWNLFFFQGGEPRTPLHGLWDVSIGERPGGELVAYVRDGLGRRFLDQEEPVPIPIGRWFQLEFYLKRAADATGEIALFQDGVEVLRRSQIRTDDSNFGQWYVGNLARGLNPSQYTLYVDDVTVRLGP